MKYQGKVEFKTQPRKVWDTVLDMEQFVACFPGVEDIEMIDDKTFTGWPLTAVVKTIPLAAP